MSDDYAGEIDPTDAWAALSAAGDVVMVDVRTPAEWTYVGGPDLRGVGRAPWRIAWYPWPGQPPDPAFATRLVEAGATPTTRLLFLCRSGVRSLAAARVARSAGLPDAWNITGGFEGPLDAAGHRGLVAGWKAAGLPWIQE
jgi:rhodanese-related sulfurtransferase